MSGRIVTVTGGARSGKSRHAAQLAAASGLPVVYLATAEGSDAEMEQRISQHRAERPAGWLTIEEPFQLTAALTEAQLPQPCIVLLDCLTVWLGGLVCPLYDLPEATAIDKISAVEASAMQETDRLREFAMTSSTSLIVVTNEVGDGIVPADPLTRFYRDLLGRLNQAFAAASDEVYLLVAGLPLRLK